MSIRIGNGYDVHAFEKQVDIGVDRQLDTLESTFITLGATQIPSDRRLIAHSDGDVVLHALCDALLGAVALGDIGEHFPDTDPALQGVDSASLLFQVYEKVLNEGYVWGNGDITIVAQTPKLFKYKPLIASNIASILKVPDNSINVKATTTEGLGPFGRGEGVAVYAIVLLTSMV